MLLWLLTFRFLCWHTYYNPDIVQECTAKALLWRFVCSNDPLKDCLGYPDALWVELAGWMRCHSQADPQLALCLFSVTLSPGYPSSLSVTHDKHDCWVLKRVDFAWEVFLCCWAPWTSYPVPELYMLYLSVGNNNSYLTEFIWWWEITPMRSILLSKPGLS